VADRQAVTPLETGDGTPARRRPDLGALIPGLFFIALAVVLMSPADLPELFDGVLVWIVVIVAGVSLLVSELRRSRRRRR